MGGVISWLIDNYDVDCVILGCTDISPLYKNDNIDLPIIDCLEVLSDVIVQKYYN